MLFFRKHQDWETEVYISTRDAEYIFHTNKASSLQSVTECLCKTNWFLMSQHREGGVWSPILTSWDLHPKVQAEQSAKELFLLKFYKRCSEDICTQHEIVRKLVAEFKNIGAHEALCIMVQRWGICSPLDIIE